MRVTVSPRVVSISPMKCAVASPSLVKLALRPASVSTGAGSSTPTSDQVPQEM